MIPSTFMLRALVPLGMAGALGLAWLRSKSGSGDESQAWRDTSLDDWRAERDREHEAAREQRQRETGTQTASETEKREDTESRLG